MFAKINELPSDSFIHSAIYPQEWKQEMERKLISEIATLYPDLKDQIFSIQVNLDVQIGFIFKLNQSNKTQTNNLYDSLNRKPNVEDR